MKRVKAFVVSAAIISTFIAGVAPALAAPSPRTNYFPRYSIAQLLGLFRIVR